MTGRVCKADKGGTSHVGENSKWERKACSCRLNLSALLGLEGRVQTLRISCGIDSHYLILILPGLKRSGSFC